MRGGAAALAPALCISHRPEQIHRHLTAVFCSPLRPFQSTPLLSHVCCSLFRSHAETAISHPARQTVKAAAPPCPAAPLHSSFIFPVPHTVCGSSTQATLEQSATQTLLVAAVPSHLLPASKPLCLPRGGVFVSGVVAGLPPRVWLQPRTPRRRTPPPLSNPPTSLPTLLCSGGSHAPQGAQAAPAAAGAVPCPEGAAAVRQAPAHLRPGSEEGEGEGEGGERERERKRMSPYPSHCMTPPPCCRPPSSLAAHPPAHPLPRSTPSRGAPPATSATAGLRRASCATAPTWAAGRPSGRAAATGSTGVRVCVWLGQLPAGCRIQSGAHLALPCAAMHACAPITPCRAGAQLQLPLLPAARSPSPLHPMAGAASRTARCARWAARSVCSSWRH